MDLLLLTIPKVTFSQIQAACPILKGIVKAHGYSCEIYDCNIEFYKRFKDTNNAEYLSDYFLVSNPAEYSDSDLALIDSEINRWINHIIDVNPKFLGISLFSYESQYTTKSICEKLAHTDIKIVLGGSGVGSAGRVGKSVYAEDLYQQNLIHAYVTGDGEQAILNILEGKESDNTNSVQYSSPIDINVWAQYYPDYDNIEFHEYQGHVTIPMNGSRGCVRQCSFCTEGLNAYGFRYRHGQNIADEMIFLANKYGRTNFYFTDSLMNGSMKAFREFCTVMAAENKTRKKKITWGGYFICRPTNQMSPEDYKIAADAGATLFNIGIESGSERIRDHMKKKFSNADMDYTISQMAKNKIKLIMLLVVGYPYETEEDFEDTLSLFRRWKPYSDNGDIYETNVGSTCQIFPDTPLYSDPNLMYTDKYNSKNPMAWINVENPSLGVAQRSARYAIACEVLEDLGYNFRGFTEVPGDWAMTMNNYSDYITEHEQEVIKTKTPYYRDL